LVPTLAPTLVPTLAPTLAPTYVPTYVPTLVPTYNPTIERSAKPTSIEPFISFTTDISLSNVQTNILDLNSQKSIILAQALTMNISSDFITFVSSSVLKNNKITFQSYNLVVTTKTNIILQGKYSTYLSNPQSLYTSLSNSIRNAVTSGTFTTNLVTISQQLNSTATISASISSIVVSSVTIQTNMTYMPTYMPTIKIKDNTITSIYNSHTLIIFVSCVAVIISFIGCYILYLFFKRRYLRYLRQERTQLQNRQLQERLINVENIEITFVS
jgi:hypothetical protein